MTMMPSGLCQSKSQQIDILVTCEGPWNRLFAAGKCRRVENHHIILLASLHEAAHLVEGISRSVRAPVLHVVQSGMIPCHDERFFTDVQPFD